MFDLNLAISMKKTLALKSLQDPVVAGHHTGAMLLEDTLPKKLLLGPKMWSGCLPSSQERPAPLCLHLRRSGWGLQGPSCQQIPLGTSCTGGCSSGGFWKDVWLLRVSRATGGHPVPVAWQCSQFHFIPLDELWMLCLQGMCRE